MKKLTVLFVAVVAMIFSSAFAQNAQVKKAGKAIGAGKMKASASLGFKMVSPKEGDSKTIIDVAQLGAYSFLSPQAAGLHFGYGINNEMHVAISMPLYTRFSVGENMSMSKTFGSPRLAFVYAKNMGAIDITAAPYLGLPFMEMSSMTMGDNTSDDDANFKQPIAFGLNFAIDSHTPGKLFWGFWTNLYFSLEKKDGDVVTSPKSLFVNLTGLVGYKVAPGMMVKLQFYYDTPNLQAEGDGVPGFGDGDFKTKLVYGMKLNKTSGFHAGALFGMGISDKSKLHDKTLMGLILDYWIKF
jgi:hypothetical protein